MNCLQLPKSGCGDNDDRSARPQGLSYFNTSTLHGFGHPVFKPTIEYVGRNGAPLMARRAPVGVCHFTDYFAEKLQSNKPPVTLGATAASDSTRTMLPHHLIARVA
jgi:hypothetical protein